MGVLEGDGYINLALSILFLAKKDNAPLWEDFGKAFNIKRKHPDVLQVSFRVSQYCLDHREGMEPLKNLIRRLCYALRCVSDRFKHG